MLSFKEFIKEEENKTPEQIANEKKEWDEFIKQPSIQNLSDSEKRTAFNKRKLKIDSALKNIK